MRYRYLFIFLVFMLFINAITNYPEEKSQVKVGDIMFCDISDGWLNIREKPDLKSNVVGKISVSAKVEILETSKLPVDETGNKGYWFKITTLNKKNTGWVASIYLSPVLEKLIVEQIESHILEISEKESLLHSEEANCFIDNKIQAYFSPSGDFLAIQRVKSFYLFRTENLLQKIRNLDYENTWAGYVVGFLPSGKLVYSNDKGTYLLDPHTKNLQRIFQDEIDCYFGYGEIVIVSDDLMISGSMPFSDLSSPYPLEKIIRYNFKNKQITYGAEIWDMLYAKLSPSRNYILYENGHEHANFTKIYEVFSNRVKRISGIDEEEMDIVPLCWLSKKDMVLIEFWQREPEIDESKEKIWIALYDAASNKVIWKKGSKTGFFPTEFHMLNSKKALLNPLKDKKIYELNLENGDIILNVNLDGYPISVSHNKKLIAYLEIEPTRGTGFLEGPTKAFVSALNGQNKKQILDLPCIRPQTAYKGMGARSPLWSPSDDFLIIFEDYKLFLIQVSSYLESSSTLFLY